MLILRLHRIAINRGPPTIYHHHQGLPIQRGILEGVVYKNLREEQDIHHPHNRTGDVHHGFCGGGARIVAQWGSMSKLLKYQNPL